MPQPKKIATPSPLSDRLELRISPKEKQVFQAAATRQDITLSKWLRLAAWLAINEHGGKVKLLELE
jgi:predicted HicB family RNase H-like nuclease